MLSGGGGTMGGGVGVRGGFIQTKVSCSLLGYGNYGGQQILPPNKPFAQEPGGMQPKSRPNYSKLGLLDSTTHYSKIHTREYADC